MSVLWAFSWLLSGVLWLWWLTSSTENHECQVFLKKQMLSAQAPFSMCKITKREASTKTLLRGEEWPRNSFPMSILNPLWRQSDNRKKRYVWMMFSFTLMPLILFYSQYWSTKYAWRSSHTHRTVEVGRDHWRSSSSTSPLKQSPLENFTQDCIQTSEWVSLSASGEGGST